MPVKALVFDVFGTVVDWRTSVIEQFETFGREKGIDANWTAFVDDWKSCYRPGMNDVNAGRLPWTTVAGIYRAKLDTLLPEYAITDLGEAEKARLVRAWHYCKPWPDVVAGLTRLREKFVLATLSNGDVACLIDMARHGGLPWDCILCAEVFRRYKPAPETYRGAIELLGVQPDEIMLVAAHNYDLRAARSHGMRTAFVARPAEYGPGQTSDLGPEEDWDVVAGDFGELATALLAGGWR